MSLCVYSHDEEECFTWERKGGFEKRIGLLRGADEKLFVWVRETRASIARK